MTMFKNYKEAFASHMRHELDPQTLLNLEVYFNVIDIPAEDTFAVDHWYYDEDEEYNLIVRHDTVAVNRKDLFKNYSVKGLTGKYVDVINCHGHTLTKQEIQKIFWDMGN